MNPVVTCDTCKGTGRTPVRQTICPCAKPCSKCSLMDKTKSGHCRICSSQNSKRYSVNLAKNQVVCAHCGKCDRVKSGHCGPCRRDYINQNWPQTLIRTTRKNSRRRGHSPATITSEWILEQFQLQNGKCFYTSMLLHIDASRQQVARTSCFDATQLGSHRQRDRLHSRKHSAHVTWLESASKRFFDRRGFVVHHAM